MYLNCHTYYSYKYGILSVEELLDQAVDLGHKQLALTDINSTSGWVDFVRHAEKRGVAAAVGIDFRNRRGAKGDEHVRPSGRAPLPGYGQSLYIGIALNAEGRHELNRFLSEHLMGKKPFPERAPEWEHVLVVYPWAFAKKISHSSSLISDSEHENQKSEIAEGLEIRNPLRPNEFIGISPFELNRFRFSEMGKEMVERVMSNQKVVTSEELSETSGLSTHHSSLVTNHSTLSPKGTLTKLVLLHTATFRGKRDFNTHRLLRAMDCNCLLSMLPEHEQGSPQDVMLGRENLDELFQDFPELISNTTELLTRCCTDAAHQELAPVKGGQSLNLQCYSGSKEEDERLIRALCEAGLPYRYPMADKEVHARVEKELDIIIKQGFVSYFLINWDIVNYARKQGYFYVGRGSGANSVVAYLMRITDVDPIELDLYFERFINLFRASPPDFDMDFSWADREDITRYIFERFPTACLLGAYSTFQFRAARRELGKVFGLPAEEIESIGTQSRHAHFQPKWEPAKREELLVKRVISDELSVKSKSLITNNSSPITNNPPPPPNDHLKQLVLRYASYLIDKPSHLSIHSCGILIPDKPITYYTATFMPPKGFPTAQISMLEAEDIGINKYDILSQRGLGKIKDSLTLIRENHPDEPKIDIHDINRFKKDEKVKELLRNGDAIGCFYVESPAMRMLMRKLEVDDYLGLVAASSVIRPGVAQSGMMQTYIERKRNPERRKDAHPVMLDIMPDTFGVMVYQEDVIKVAHYFAGLSLAEADVLRRGMSGKYRSREEFLQVKDKFFSNCIKEKGYTQELTAEIWRQTESFAGYAFAKGHSASYAVESYQSLFLKAYYPIEYMVATVNNGGGFYTREHYLHEARMCGAIIEGPCIQESNQLTRVDGKVIYMGFHMVKGLDQEVIDRIISHRTLSIRSMPPLEGSYGTPFESLADLLDRVPMGMEQLSILIHVGALRNLPASRENLSVASDELSVNSALPTNHSSPKTHHSSTSHSSLSPKGTNHSSSGSSKKHLLWQAYAILEKQIKKPTPQQRLFSPEAKQYDLPQLDHQVVEDAFDEMEYLGFPLCHPFDLLREPVNDHVRLSNLHEYVGKTVTVYGYLVTAKNTKTIKGDRMNFGNFVDRDGAFLDTVHFPQVAARYPFRGKGVYAITGKVVEEWNFQTIEVETMERLAYVDDVRYAEEIGPFERRHAPNAQSPISSAQGPIVSSTGDKDSNRIRSENRRRKSEIQDSELALGAKHDRL